MPPVTAVPYNTGIFTSDAGGICNLTPASMLSFFGLLSLSALRLSLLMRYPNTAVFTNVLPKLPVMASLPDLIMPSNQLICLLQNYNWIWPMLALYQNIDLWDIMLFGQWDWFCVL